MADQYPIAWVAGRDRFDLNSFDWYDDISSSDSVQRVDSIESNESRSVKKWIFHDLFGISDLTWLFDRLIGLRFNIERLSDDSYRSNSPQQRPVRVRDRFLGWSVAPGNVRVSLCARSQVNS